MTHAMGEAVNAAPTPSKGLGFAAVVLVFMVAEISIYGGVENAADSHRIMLLGMIIVSVVEATGMWLTWTGRYKLGGNLQIAASVLHVIDLMGVIGVIGGILSRRYPERLAALNEE